MTNPNMIAITPIYGWGWIIEGNDAAEVPETILTEKLVTHDGKLTGKIAFESAAFPDQTVSLTRRHKDWDGFVNVEISDDNGTKLACGYARVDADDRAFSPLIG